MKSALVKRVLSIIMIAVLLTSNVMPVMAEGASVSGNEIEAVDEEETTVEESSVEESTEEVFVEESSEEESFVEESSEEVTSEETAETIEETVVETTEETVEITEEEVPLADGATVSLEPVTVNGVTITVSGPASAFAEGTIVTAKEVEPAEVVIEAAEAEEQAKVLRFKAFDITLMCDGKIVQPLNGEEIKVNFEGDMLIPNADEKEVVVYHVDAEDEIEKMNAEVVAEEDDAAVEMTTTHFSTYVIMITGENEGIVEVTINHYLNDSNKTRLYVTQKESVERGGSISGFANSDSEFEVESIKIGNEPIELKDGKYTVDVNDDKVAIDVYYKALTGTAENEATLFDYVNGGVDNPNSINYYQNYKKTYKRISEELLYQKAYKETRETYSWFSKEEFDAEFPNYYRQHYAEFLAKYDKEEDKKNWSNRLATYSYLGAYLDYKLMLYPKGVDYRANANAYNPGALHKQVFKGLLSGVSGSDYETVNFAYDDPGFFSKDERAGKTIYADEYSLIFDKKGFEHTLTKVKNIKSGKIVCEQDNNGKMTNFFPLNEKYNGWGNNEYFGLRYDFTFEVGDYVGDMIYSFSGDDDLWVCLDGEVILDIGGIHGVVDDSVDVWKVLLNKKQTDTVTYEEKAAYLADDNNRKKSHTVTVLFMERGANQSNCNMKFVLPNYIAKESVVTNVPKADLELLKKDSVSKEAISGVGFTLYSDAECTIQKGDQQHTVDGKTIFTDLRAGVTYYLKETDYNANEYLENNTVYKVTVTAQGENATAVMTKLDGGSVDKEGKAYVIENTPITPIALEFYKADFYNKEQAIEDVEFTLKKDNAQGEVVGTATSNAEGYFKFEGLRAGKYYMEESPVSGYAAPEKGWTIEVVLSDTGSLSYAITDGPEGLWTNATQAVNKNMIFNQPYVSVTFTKIDGNTDKPMSGVEFKLYEGNVENAEKLVNTVTSNANGIVTFDTLMANQDYLLVETTPEGYIEVTTPWIVRVDYEDGKFVQKIFNAKAGEISGTWVIDGDAYEEAVIENMPKRGPLTITKTVDKVDEVHGIAAFIFKIECPDQSILYRTISFTEAGTKSVTIEDLPFGDYKVTELKTLRYTQTSVIPSNEVKIESTEGASVSFTNDKTFKKLYSHADVVVNKATLIKDANGNIIGATTSQEKMSTSNEESE